MTQGMFRAGLLAGLSILSACKKDPDPTTTSPTGTTATPTGTATGTGSTTATGTTSSNQAPVAVDDAAQVDAGSQVNIAVLANDTDDDGIDPGTLTVVSAPALGDATVHTDGTIDYTHRSGGDTSDSLTYTVADWAGAVSNTATVTIEILGSCLSVDPSDPYYDRFEGTANLNDCTTDDDCVVGGCSGEVCAAESVFTTCEGLPTHPEGSCGCVEGTCAWTVCPT